VSPVLSLLFLCSFFNRTNVSGARALGREADLHLPNSGFNQDLLEAYSAIGRGKVRLNIDNGEGKREARDSCALATECLR
ncbi:hypothetical protein BT67DRAFT_390684, partial [Trichocladium antarcticum]